MMVLRACRSERTNERAVTYLNSTRRPGFFRVENSSDAEDDSPDRWNVVFTIHCAINVDKWSVLVRHELRFYPADVTRVFLQVGTPSVTRSPVTNYILINLDGGSRTRNSDSSCLRAGKQADSAGSATFAIF